MRLLTLWHDLRDWLADRLMGLRGRQPDAMRLDPRVAAAVRQQRAVTEAAKVHDSARLFEWQAAGACCERKLCGAAAEWAIRASSEFGTCKIVEEVER